MVYFESTGMSKNIKQGSSTIAEKCCQLRSKLGVTQNEMAKKLKVCLRTWQSWEAGKNEPRAKYLLSLLQIESQVEGKPEIASICRQLRETIDITRKEMAKLVGVRPHTWGYWELGKQTPNTSSRVLIEKILKHYLVN